MTVHNTKRTLRGHTQHTCGSVKIAHSQYVSLTTTHCSNMPAITTHRSVCVCVCVCVCVLGALVVGWQTLLRCAQKNKHCFISNIWNCYPPNPYSFGARSSIRTIIAQSLPLPPSFPASDGQRKAGARGMEGINNYSADATPCRMVPIMGAQRRGTAEAPLVGPSDLAARLSHGRPTPSSAQTKHPPWGSNPRPQG